MMGKRARVSCDRNERLVTLRLQTQGKVAEIHNEASLARCVAAVNGMSDMKTHFNTLSPEAAQTLMKNVSSTSNNHHRRAVSAKNLFSESFALLSVLETRVKSTKALLETATDLAVTASYVTDHVGMDWTSLTDDLLKKRY